MSQILNEEQTKAAQAKLEADMKQALEMLMKNKALLTTGAAARKFSELMVKGIDQGTKAKRLVKFFGTNVVSAFKEAMAKKRAQDKVIEDAIRLFNQK